MSTTAAEIEIVCGDGFTWPDVVIQLIAQYAVAHPHDAYCTMYGKGYIDDLKLVKHGDEAPKGYTRARDLPIVRNEFYIYISRSMDRSRAVNMLNYPWSDFLNGRPCEPYRGDGIGVASDLNSRPWLCIYQDGHLCISMVPAGPLLDIAPCKSYLPATAGVKSNKFDFITSFYTFQALNDDNGFKTFLNFRFDSTPNSQDCFLAKQNNEDVFIFIFMPITRLEAFRGAQPSPIGGQSCYTYQIGNDTFHLVVTRGNGSPIVMVQTSFDVFSGDPQLDYIDLCPPPSSGRNHWCWQETPYKKLILHANPSDTRSILARQVQGTWYVGSEAVQMTGILFHGFCGAPGGAFSRSLPKYEPQIQPGATRSSHKESWCMIGLTALGREVGQFAFGLDPDTKHITGHICNGNTYSATYTHASDTKTTDNLRLYTTAGCIVLTLAEPVTCTPVTVWSQDEFVCLRDGFGVVFDESLAATKMLPRVPNWIDLPQALYIWTNNEWRRGHLSSIRQGRMSATELHCMTVYGGTAEVNRFPVAERFLLGVAYNHSEVWRDGQRVLPRPPREHHSAADTPSVANARVGNV